MNDMKQKDTETQVYQIALEGDGFDNAVDGYEADALETPTTLSNPESSPKRFDPSNPSDGWVREQTQSQTNIKAKKWWKSKTLWFNLLAWGLYDFGHYSMPELASQMSPEHYLYMSLGVNAALRFVTDRAIKIRGGE